jgi:hypothetical protein
MSEPENPQQATGDDTQQSHVQHDQVVERDEHGNVTNVTSTNIASGNAQVGQQVGVVIRF